jgi:hypothetical protein
VLLRLEVGWAFAPIAATTKCTWETAQTLHLSSSCKARPTCAIDDDCDCDYESIRVVATRSTEIEYMLNIMDRIGMVCVISDGYAVACAERLQGSAAGRVCSY